MKRSGFMKRVTRLATRSSIARKARVNPVNRKRRAKSFARAYGSGDRVEFINTLPCGVRNRECDGAIENAHIEGGGTSYKADADRVVPMCHHHHVGVLHSVGRDSFEARYGVDLSALAATTDALWRSHCARMGIDVRVRPTAALESSRQSLTPAPLADTINNEDRPS